MDCWTAVWPPSRAGRWPAGRIPPVHGRVSRFPGGGLSDLRLRGSRRGGRTSRRRVSRADGPATHAPLPPPAAHTSPACAAPGGFPGRETSSLPPVGGGRSAVAEGAGGDLGSHRLLNRPPASSLGLRIPTVPSPGPCWGSVGARGPASSQARLPPRLRVVGGPQPLPEAPRKSSRRFAGV